MTRLEMLEEKIRELNSEELAHLRDWFYRYDAAAWDAQLEKDALEGKLDRLAEEAETDYKAGKAKEL